MVVLTLSWREPLSYRNQSIDLQSKSMNWFLYDNGLHHEKVKKPNERNHNVIVSFVLLDGSLKKEPNNVRLTHLFSVHPFRTNWKHQKILRFSVVFRGYRKGTLETNGLSQEISMVVGVTLAIETLEQGMKYV